MGIGRVHGDRGTQDIFHGEISVMIFLSNFMHTLVLFTVMVCLSLFSQNLRFVSLSILNGVIIYYNKSVIVFGIFMA